MYLGQIKLVLLRLVDIWFSLGIDGMGPHKIGFVLKRSIKV